MAKASKKAAPAKKNGKKATARPISKSELLSIVAEKTELTKKQVSAVLEALEEQIILSLKTGSGQFVMPGIVKFQKKVVPAKPEREVRVPGSNPPRMVTKAAEPASTKPVARILKKLKESLK